MRTHFSHGFSSRARRVALALVVATTALAGLASTGCETDDSSTPLPPAVKDATADQAAADGAGGDAAPKPEASTFEAGTGDAASDAAADTGAE